MKRQLENNPFFDRGPIKPGLEAPWSAMHQFTEHLQTVTNELKRTPPDFFNVVGPPLSGKTTFACQVISKLEEESPSILPVYINLHFISGTATEADLVNGLTKSVENAVLKHLGDRQSPNLMASGALKRTDLPANLQSLVRVFTDLSNRLSEFDTVLFIFDELDSLSNEIRIELLRFFRALHGRRAGSLRNVSVMLLTAQLQFDLGENSPYNVAVNLELSDLRPKEVEQFIRRAEKHTDGINFEQDALNYLFHITMGQLPLIQELCHRTIAMTTQQTISPELIARSVIDCFESPPDSVAHMLEAESFSQEALAIIAKLTLNKKVLPHRVKSGIKEVMTRGIAKKAIQNNQLAFRSPIIKQMFIAAHCQLDPIPGGLTDVEELLLSLPPVVAIALDSKLEAEGRARLHSHLGGKLTDLTGYEDYWRLLAEFLSERILDTHDRVSIAEFYRTYADEDLGLPVVADVARVVGKVYAYWAIIDENPPESGNN